jgi:hypothetical protein
MQSILQHCKTRRGLDSSMNFNLENREKNSGLLVILNDFIN